MTTVTEHVRRHALEACDYVERCPFTYEQLWVRNWSPEFEALMRENEAVSHIDIPAAFLRAMRIRLVIGEMRYGREWPICDGRHEGSTYDLLPGYLSKSKLFVETRNHEYLVDIANYCLLMWMFPRDNYDAPEDLVEDARWCALAFDSRHFHPVDRCDAHHEGR
jgi:hypothetical protein